MRRVEAAGGLRDHDVGYDKAGLNVYKVAHRRGAQGAYEFPGGRDLLHGDAAELRYPGQLVCAELSQIFADYRLRERGLRVEPPELQQQAFAQIPGRDAGGLQPLDRMEQLEIFALADVQKGRSSPAGSR